MNDSLIGARLADRFVVERQLGEGGMGVVYEALDVQRGERVALKTLDKMDGASVYRLKKEFRVLADVVHPNLIRLHELVSDDQRWFFTMARAAGVSFLEHVREDATLAEDPTMAEQSAASVGLAATVSPAPSTGPLREGHLRRALVQLVQGVQAIHAAGKLHRDLKPGNVMVSPDGHVVILDFGLVEPVADATRSAAGAAGTPGYMAPEQLSEGGACAASDWYAVGTMIYESLTGRLPFTGSAMEVLGAKYTRRDPIAVRTLWPSAPEDLAELAMDLLRSKPSERPDGARILERLGGTPPAVAPSVRTPGSGRPLFVGRETELTRLHDAFTRTRGGEPTIVLLEGLSGIGKSALVERFLDDVRRDAGGAAVVLSGRCYERESVPFKALDAVIDALSRYLRDLDGVTIARLTPRNVPELCRVFPVLARVPALSKMVAARAAVPDPNEVRRRAFLALKEILARIADERALVLTIDDLQWGDVDSGLLLTQLISPPDPPRLLLVGSYRADEIGRSELLKMLRAHAEHTREHVETISLQPLDASVARDLATALLRARGVEPSPEVVATMASEAGGSPFFLTELSRSDHEAHAPSLPELLAGRISELPADARRLLEVISIAGGPVARDVALRASGLGTADDAGIPVLTAASLVRGSGAKEDASLETYHDRIRETVVARLNPERASAHHLALAEVLATRPDPPAEQLALHYREGGRREEAAIWTLRAAERAVDAIAFDRAAELYGRALELMPEGDPTARRRVQVKQGDALANAGRGAEAADVYLAAARGAPEAEDIDLERRAARELLWSGSLDRGLALSDRVAKRVGLWIPRSRFFQRAVAMFGVLYLYLRGVPARRRTPAEVGDDALLGIDVGQSLTIALIYVDTARAAVIGSLSLVRALRAREPTRIGVGLTHACWIFAGILRPNHPLLAQWTRIIGELGSSEDEPRLTAYAPLAAGAAAFVGGSYRATLDLQMDAELKLERCNLVAAERHEARVMVVWSLFVLGQIRTFADRLAMLKEEARARGNLGALQVLVCGPGPVAWLVTDAVDAAEREVEEIRLALPGREFHHYTYLIARFFILFYRGDGKEYHELIEREWAAVRRSGLLSVHSLRRDMFFVRGAAAVAAARDEPDKRRARSILAAAMRHARELERNPVIGSAPFAAVIHAAVAFANAERSTAMERLSFAVDKYTNAEMMVYAACARRRLGQLRGGDEGQALIAEADAFMTSEGILKPHRFAAMLAPGFPD